MATQKIPMKSITFLWSESSMIEDGKVYHSFKEASRAIASAAYFAPKDGAYDKTAFVLEWEDGRQHKGRIDIQPEHAHKYNIVGEHVKGFYKYLLNLDEETFRSYGYDDETREELKSIINDYAFED